MYTHLKVNTFAANYTGHPFMQSIRENRPMWYLVLASYASLVVAASGLAPSLESWLQLAPFPEGFRGTLLAILAADTALVFLVEGSTRWVTRRFGSGSSGGGGGASGGQGAGRKPGRGRGATTAGAGAGSKSGGEKRKSRKGAKRSAAR